MTRTMITLAAVVVLGLATATQVQAQERFQQSVVMNDYQLKEMLENLGLEFTTVKSTTGLPMYRIPLSRGGWKFTVYAMLSPSKRWVWLTAPLLDLPTQDKARPDVMEMILRKNNDIAPISFVCKGRQLYLQMPITSEGLKPLRLRKDMDTFLDTIRETEKLWDPAKHPTKYPPATTSSRFSVKATPAMIGD